MSPRVKNISFLEREIAPKFVEKPSGMLKKWGADKEHWGLKETETGKGRELSLQGSQEAIVFLSYRLPVRDTGETTEEEEAHLLPVLALLSLPKQPCFAWL